MKPLNLKAILAINLAYPFEDLAPQAAFAAAAAESAAAAEAAAKLAMLAVESHTARLMSDRVSREAEHVTAAATLTKLEREEVTYEAEVAAAEAESAAVGCKLAAKAEAAALLELEAADMTERRTSMAALASMMTRKVWCCVVSLLWCTARME